MGTGKPVIMAVPGTSYMHVFSIEPLDQIPKIAVQTKLLR